jgi:hypothetical protein
MGPADWLKNPPARKPKHMPKPTRREFVMGLALSGLAPIIAGCGGGRSHSSDGLLSAAVWPEADALFHSDPLWLGGDGVYSIDLGQGRVLWLFQDSFIATSAADVRSAATIVHNTIAVQNGCDPTTASIQFYWANNSSNPGAFFQNPNTAQWYWPHHGVRIGNTLLIFLAAVESSSGGLGFAGVGWQAVFIDNPDADPTAWNLRYLQQSNQFTITVGESVLVIGDYVYAYSTPTNNPGPIYLARWPLTQASQGALTNIEWYMGGSGWVSPTSLSAAPAAVMGNGQSEFNYSANSTDFNTLVQDTSLYYPRFLKVNWHA